MWKNQGIIPKVGIIQIREKTVRNVSLTLVEVINDTAAALGGIQISLNSWAKKWRKVHILDFWWPVMMASVPLLILLVLLSLIKQAL